VLWLNPLNGEALAIGTALTTKLVSVTASMPRVAKYTLTSWLVQLPPELFGGRVVRGLQRYLSGAASSVVARRQEIMLAAEVLDLMFDANNDAGCPVPLPEFHNAALSDALDLRDEYKRYVEDLEAMPHHSSALMRPSPPRSICQVPFLLTPSAKSLILQGEASMQKQHVVQSSAISAMMQGIHPSLMVFLDIQVRRPHILQDALSQLMSRPDDLKKPLRVTFTSNGVPEEGVDEGGVSREFFQLLVADIFRADYGMFTYSEETRTFWFNPSSLESGVEFQLVGVVLGLAIYNGIILDVHFPQVVYKKLLGVAPTFADLQDVQPSLARGLLQLLQFEGDVEATFCRTFDVEYEFYGTTRTEELVPGGSAKAVTAANREEYVERYTRWVLTDGVDQQFRAFAHGFHQVCGGVALSLFRHDELELLVCGLPHLDFGELQRGAKYEGGYSESHGTVQSLWSVLNGFSTDQRRRFLSFVTGCPRAPVGGLGQLTLVVQRAGPDTDRLPTAHTCFNSLLLPDYATKDKLHKMLLLAIDNAQGFGLK